MNHPLLHIALGMIAAVLLSSCVDPNYYGGSYGYVGSSSYSTLPYGYQTVYVSGTPYYYHGKSWYRYHGGRYVVCPRPYGYHGSIGHTHHHGTISRLPYGCRKVVVHGRPYYNHGNHWYRKSGSRYVTCSKPSGYRDHKKHTPYDHHKKNTRYDHHKRDDYHGREQQHHHDRKSGDRDYDRKSSLISDFHKRNRTPDTSCQKEETSPKKRKKTVQSEPVHSVNKPQQFRLNRRRD